MLTNTRIYTNNKINSDKKVDHERKIKMEDDINNVNINNDMREDKSGIAGKIRIK